MRIIFGNVCMLFGDIWLEPHFEFGRLFTEKKEGGF